MSAEKSIQDSVTQPVIGVEEEAAEHAPPPPPTIREEDEEDIPPDFFDDFSNQDFMEGLDIVDTWDDETQGDGLNKTKDETSKSEDDKEDKRNRHARITFPKDFDEREFAQKSSKERGPRFKDLREKIGRADERRDPEKTRRDILKDKERCAKDKEVKMMNEKLRVVETGLVPPGMEMEVDLSEIRSLKDNRGGKVIRNASPNKINKSKFKSRSRSYERFRFRVRLRTRSRSREKRRTRDPMSPRRRLRSRSRSRSPYRKFSRDRRLSRELKSPKPRRRTRDEDSPLSDRERWLRRYRRSISSRNRSISPERKRKDILRRLDSEVKEEKQSFLEEIHQKLNESSHSSQIAVQHTMQLRTSYVPVQTPPQPVPPVQQNPFVPYDQSMSQYDQQFFIGTCDLSARQQAVGAYAQPVPVPAPCPAPITILPTTSQPIHVPTSFHSPLGDCSIAPLINDNPLFPSPIQEKGKNALEETDKKALAKLLEDKKISLSDFLTITSRPDPRPVNLQQKISVISRCQDAIKELGGDNKLTGRLFIKHCNRPETPDRPHASPLRKIPIVRLNFTTFAKSLEEEASFSTTTNKLLRAVGVLKELPQHTNEQQQQQPEKTKLPRQRLPRHKRSNNLVVTTQPTNSMQGTKFLMKMCQTDPFKCSVCEDRAARKFETQETQCETTVLVDVSTQTEAESSPVKSKSLSHMTPAQILAEIEMKKEEEKFKSRMDGKGEVLEQDSAGGAFKNKERSVELDHGDKDTLTKSGEKLETGWSNKKRGFAARKKMENSRGDGPPYFRSPRGFKSFRPQFNKRPYNSDDADVYGPNFDEDEDDVSDSFVQYESFNNFDDSFNNYGGGPSHRRPFYEPPEHIKRKFNRRFL